MAGRVVLTAGLGPKGKHWETPMKHAPSVAFRRVWSLLLLGGRRGGKSQRRAWRS